MFKVICINGVDVGDFFSTSSGVVEADDEYCIYNGQPYTVIEQVGKWYRLAERDYRNLYLKSRFTRLSNTYVTQLVNEKELINQ